MFNLEEKLARFYRSFFSNVTENSKLFSLKKIVYQISLFVAKKRGYLPFFFSKNEKNFDLMKFDEQYQVFLKNDKYNVELNKENSKLPSIDLVLFSDGQVENINKILEIVSAHKHVNLCIISKQSSNYFESKLRDLNVEKYKIIKKRKDEKIQRVLNGIISESKSDFMLFLDSTKGTIYDNSLHWISKFSNKDTDIIYCDSDFVKNKRTNPFFKPEWSPQLLLSFNYIGDFVIYSTALLKKIDGFDETIASYEYELLLRATKVTDKIIHISKILFGEFEKNENEKINNDKICLQNFLNKEQINSEIIVNHNYFSIKSKNNSKSLVSIIIPTKNNEKLLVKCIKSIQKSTYKNYEIIIVNNGNKIESLHGISCKIINYNESFNF